MGKTFLSHYKYGCMGDVVIDASTAIKLYAPSYKIARGGLSGLMLDVNIVQDGNLIPSYWCIKCKETIPTPCLGSDLSAVCQVCGDLCVADDLNIHEEIITICNKCLKAMNDKLCGHKIKNVRVESYMECFGIVNDVKTTPLVNVLKATIRL
jgi:hypothetical protein